MEVPGAGQQEPGAAAPAAAAAAAPGEEIDLSLDDIIKRHQAQPNRKPWQHQPKTQNQASGSRRPRFQSWGPPSLPGSSRFPQGFWKPSWARKPFWSRMSTPGPRAAGQMKGRSPLNRPALAQQDKPGKGPPGRNGNRAPADSQPEAPARAKAFKTARTPLPFRRPFRSFNQGRAFLQSQVKFNFNQRQIRPRREQNLSRVRRGRMQPSSGAVLTVSVSNPQAGHPQGPGPKRPFLRRRNSQTPQLRWQPRGVMLRFNFRAMANQTSVTLNERFSGLRHQRHFSAERNASRMVTLP
ncbi:UAP56-interacting factor-like isoform X2 [Pseudonaja textilis]|uniref:UAP56-interacting factor-like isoform X2 n=1 Tax=Pseudonaja textilis TaxID=8673 RepID=UPI000EA971B4|nr:UAP56-interacting factor-like isoform X2 [Pseudonaja textilis]